MRKLLLTALAVLFTASLAVSAQAGCTGDHAKYTTQTADTDQSTSTVIVGTDGETSD